MFWVQLEPGSATYRRTLRFGQERLTGVPVLNTPSQIMHPGLKIPLDLPISIARLSLSNYMTG
jgi:hypothetical protein